MRWIDLKVEVGTVNEEIWVEKTVIKNVYSQIE